MFQRSVHKQMLWYVHTYLFDYKNGQVGIFVHSMGEYDSVRVH